MSINKKGIMLHFIISVILAIILFSIAFGVVAKVFSLSDQAKDSFNDLVKEVNKFANSNKEQTSKLLIMDANTAIVIFDTNKSTVFRSTTETIEIADPEPTSTVGGETNIDGTTIYNDYLTFPSQCTGMPCMCLCKELKSIKLLSSNENLIEREYSCNKIICKELDHPAKSWSRFRKVVPDNLEKQDPRRSTVTLTKQGDKVVLE